MTKGLVLYFYFYPCLAEDKDRSTKYTYIFTFIEREYIYIYMLNYIYKLNEGFERKVYLCGDQVYNIKRSQG